MAECVSSKFDYFDAIPIQTSIVDSYFIDYSPVSALNHQGPINFIVHGSDHQYLDLANSILSVKCKILKADNDNLAADSGAVGPVNYTFHSLWSDIHVEICGRQVSETNGMYCYKALLETLLTNSGPVKKGQLQRALWSKDTTGKMEICTKDGANTGYNDRAEYFELSN